MFTNETQRLATMNAAGSAWAYLEQGFTPRVAIIDGLPVIQPPAEASEWTHALAKLTGNIAEALEAWALDMEAGRPTEQFTEYLASSTYANTGEHWNQDSALGRGLIISRVTARITRNLQAIQALAEQCAPAGPTAVAA